LEEVNLIFPNQLFKKNPLFEYNSYTFLIEENLYFKQYKFHKNKILFHRISMMKYKDFISNQFQTIKYIESHEVESDIRILLEKLIEKGLKKVNYIDPCDNWLNKRLLSFSDKLNLNCLESPLFLNSNSENLKFFNPDKSKFFQTSFYKQQRKKFNILIQDDKPVGGKWTFDDENRKKYPKGKIPPEINFPPYKKNFLEDGEKYIEKYLEEIIVIKCGGSVLLDDNLFRQFIEDISVIYKLGLSVIVVHGGGKNIKKKLDKLNIESKFIDGLRVTDEKTIKVVEEALLELNSEIINNLKNLQTNAESVAPHNKNIIKVKPEKKELGFVGSPKEIDLKGILKIIKEKKIPIVVPMGTSDDKKTYNINADIAAGSVAKELNSRRLLLMTDVEGVLDKNKKLIPEINSSIAEKMLKDGDISGGMIPKINTCLDAVNNGVTGVVIVDGRKPHSILFELFSDKGAGTLIRK